MTRLLLVSLAFGAGAVGRAAAQGVTPVQSSASITVSATLPPEYPGLVIRSDSQQQSASLNPLSSSTSLNLSNANATMVLQGANAISWVDATHGTVTYSNVGWRVTLDGQPQTGGVNTAGPVRYEFLGPDATATLAVNYSTTLTGANTFGAQGFYINPYVVRNGAIVYDHENAIDRLTTSSGTYEYQFATLAGSSQPGNVVTAYGFEIGPTGSFAGGLFPLAEASMSGTFGFVITPVPEPGSAVLVGVAGLVLWGARRGRVTASTRGTFPPRRSAARW